MPVGSRSPVPFSCRFPVVHPKEEVLVTAQQTPDPEVETPTRPDLAGESEPDFFAQLDDVRESIVDGVITCW